VFPQEIVEARTALLSREPWFRHLYESPQSRLATVADLLRALDEDGVTMAVALSFGWRLPGLCRDTNSSIVEAIRPYRQRIIPFCAVVPGTADVEKEIERCAALGFRGVGELYPDGQGFDLANERHVRPLVEACRAHRMIILLHASEPVGHQYAGKGRSTPERLERFLSLAQGVPVVLAHWGGGLLFYELMPEVRELAAQVAYDTAATPYLYDPRAYQIGSVLAPDRLLFGSDFPLMRPRKALAYLEKAGLPAKAKQALLWENGARVLGLG